jgi:BirA family biotin operon repressor/biotin-[acetyl-CoA-carboxylase] ligase
MAVYTGNPRFSATLLPGEIAESLVPTTGVEPSLKTLLDTVFPGFPAIYTAPQAHLPLDHLLLSEFSPRSQYDQLIELVRDGIELPDRLACLSGSGLDFHGFKGRSWVAVSGNIHLAVHFRPAQPVARFGPAFTALATLSVVDALDALPGLEGRPSIKWINDVLLNGAKVAGSLQFTQSQDHTVSCAILGIGLNVEVAPKVLRSPMVPGVGSVREFLPDAVAAPRLQARVLKGLLSALENNYLTLLAEGAGPLIQRYRERCSVVGEEVTVCSDSPDQEHQILARGRVAGLGDNLELLLAGRPDPITGGRLIVARDEEKTDTRASDTDCGARVRPFSGFPTS